MSLKKQTGESFISVLLIIGLIALMVTPGGRDFLLTSLSATADFLGNASKSVSNAAG